MNSENNIKNAIFHKFSLLRKEKNIYTPEIEIKLKSFSEDIEDCYTGIVDTGSEITLFSSEVIQKYNFPSTGTHRMLESAVCSNPIEILPCYGQIKVESEAKGNYKVIEIHSCNRKYLRQDILLGMNFITKYNIHIYGAEEKLIIEEEKKTNFRLTVKIV